MTSEVFLLYAGEYEDRGVVDVFATLDAAKAARHDHRGDPVWSETAWGWNCEWHAVRPARPSPPLTFETVSVPVVNGVATLPDGRQVAVGPTVTRVDVPVMPEGVRFGPIAESTSSCDFSIERRPLNS